VSHQTADAVWKGPDKLNVRAFFVYAGHDSEAADRMDLVNGMDGGNWHFFQAPPFFEPARRQEKTRQF
jgi:hypothetical protein